MSTYVGNQFITAIRPLVGLVGYGQHTMSVVSIPYKDCIQVLHIESCIRTALSRGIWAIYHTPLGLTTSLYKGLRTATKFFSEVVRL